MNTFLLRFSGLFVALFSLQAVATTRYVDLNSSNATSPFTDWTTAATNIQDAIDAAANGDLILVTNGVYATGGAIINGSLSNRVAVYRAVTVQSVNGPAVTTILGYQIPQIGNGDGAVRCVYLTNGAAIIGFMLTGGATRGGAATSNERQGGGVFCRASSAVVSNCVIIGNTADSSGGGGGAGKYFNCSIIGNSATNGGGINSATLTDCIVSGNTAVYGGGMNNGTANQCVLSNNVALFGGASWYGTLSGCLIVSNVASSLGGGAYFGTVTNCTLLANSAPMGGGTYSAAVYRCLLRGNSASNSGGGANGGSVHGCAVLGNSASSGGGLYNVNATACTLTDNYASGNGGGASGGYLNNCIICFNTAGQSDSSNYSIYINGTTLRYCCTTPALIGPGNFDADPLLADNFHLTAASPCRGAGSASYAFGKDFDGEAWASVPAVGCDEFFSTATGALGVSVSAAYTNFAPDFAVDFRGSIDGWADADRWEFGDGTIVSNKPVVSHSWNMPGDYPVILHAYNQSNPGGISATSIVHVTAEIHYVSVNNSTPAFPFLSWATAATNIQDAIDAATLPGAMVLVSNGVYQTGGRVIHGAMTNRVAVSKPLVVQSVNGPANTFIVGNQTLGTILGDVSVRCVYLTNGARLVGFTLTNGATRNLFFGDAKTEATGGGIWCESISAIASNCVISGCAGYYGGGAAFGSLDRCTLLNNQAGSEGGGAFYVAMNNCLVVSNSAGDSGGGLDQVGSYYSVNNSVFAGNSARSGGGAMQAILRNCTLSGNSGGGAYSCSLYNSVCYYNNNQNYDSGTLTNCCTIPLPAGSSANFTNAPQFMDPMANDFRLQPGSPCINSGNDLLVETSTDFEGNARIVGGAVDLGAFEFQSPGATLPSLWAQSFGLTTDGAMDSDGDGLSNFAEWIAGTIPTNSSSTLLMFPLSNNVTGLKVSWQSVSGKTYFVQRSTNLLTQPAFSPMQSNVIGVAGMTTYNDLTATNAGPYFYRVGVQ